MKKKLLQNHTKMMELESRLNKNSYLSKDHIPGSADGKIFLLMEKFNQIPDRKLYPNFYHWYIILKQFSCKTREKWAEKEEEDQLILQIINWAENDIEQFQDKGHLSPMSEPSLSPEFNCKFTEQLRGLRLDSTPITFMLNITFKESISEKVKEIIARISKEKIDIIDHFILDETTATDLSITIRATEQQCQTLKDLISKWPEVKQFHTKQRKFMNKSKTMSVKG